MSKQYVNNAYNRSVGRVGQSLGSHVISRSSSSRGSSNSGGASASGSVSVSGYTKSNGTYVAPHTRSTSGSSSSNTVLVSGYTKADGTKVESYIRSKPTSTSTASSAAESKVPKITKRKDIVERNYTIGELENILRKLAVSDESLPAYQYGYDYLQQQQVEENWSRSGIELSTSIPKLRDHVNPSASHFHGKVIPHSELKLSKEIGRGGFGVVVAGLWNGTPIAFKKLHYSQMSQKRLESFLSEVTIFASLDHPHTIKLFGAVADVDNNCVGIVMEYLRRSLFKAIFIDRSAFTDGKKKEIISQTADALVYLHDGKNIAHCDVKSENILLDSNDVVKLGDFGLSAVKSATQITQSVLRAGQGTPRYSAPEVLRGELLSKSQLFPTDIYSLAIVVFEVIAEEEPFDGLNLKQLEKNVGSGDTRPTSDVTAIDLLVKALLDNCWNNLPSKRPKAKEFQDEWRRLSKPLATTL